MDLKQMQYFLCLAQERNVTRAAQRLHIVQPALSMQIAKLEKSFGKRLFFRTPQGVSLTPAGEEFERLVTPIVRDVVLSPVMSRYVPPCAPIAQRSYP